MTLPFEVLTSCVLPLLGGRDRFCLGAADKALLAEYRATTHPMDPMFHAIAAAVPVPNAPDQRSFGPAIERLSRAFPGLSRLPPGHGIGYQYWADRVSITYVREISSEEYRVILRDERERVPLRATFVRSLRDIVDGEFGDMLEIAAIGEWAAEFWISPTPAPGFGMATVQAVSEAQLRDGAPLIGEVLEIFRPHPDFSSRAFCSAIVHTDTCVFDNCRVVWDLLEPSGVAPTDTAPLFYPDQGGTRNYGFDSFDPQDPNASELDTHVKEYTWMHHEAAAINF